MRKMETDIFFGKTRKNGDGFIFDPIYFRSKNKYAPPFRQRTLDQASSLLHNFLAPHLPHEQPKQFIRE